MFFTLSPACERRPLTQRNTGETNHDPDWVTDASDSLAGSGGVTTGGGEGARQTISAPAPAPLGVPQEAQNFAPGASCVPHPEQKPPPAAAAGI